MPYIEALPHKSAIESRLSQQKLKQYNNRSVFRLKPSARPAYPLLSQSLFDKLCKFIGTDNLYARTERQHTDNDLRFIGRVIFQMKQVSVIVNTLRLLFKVRKVEHYALERIPLVIYLQGKLSYLLYLRFFVPLPRPGIKLTVYNSSKIYLSELTAVHYYSYLIVLFGIFKPFGEKSQRYLLAVPVVKPCDYRQIVLYGIIYQSEPTDIALIAKIITVRVFIVYFIIVLGEKRLDIG